MAYRAAVAERRARYGVADVLHAVQPFVAEAAAALSAARHDCKVEPKAQLPREMRGANAQGIAHGLCV